MCARNLQKLYIFKNHLGCTEYYIYIHLEVIVLLSCAFNMGWGSGQPTDRKKNTFSTQIRSYPMAIGRGLISNGNNTGFHQNTSYGMTLQWKLYFWRLNSKKNNCSGQNCNLQSFQWKLIFLEVVHSISITCTILLISFMSFFTDRLAKQN